MCRPWYEDFANPPADSDMAQAVWIAGRWRFVPVSNGVPLYPFCDDIHAAETVVNNFEDRLAEIESLKSGAREDGDLVRVKEISELEAQVLANSEMSEAGEGHAECPDDFRIFAADRRNLEGECIVMQPGGRIVGQECRNFDEALYTARLISGTADRPSV